MLHRVVLIHVDPKKVPGVILAGDEGYPPF